jgi:4-hydroxy-4-methyl-2-oxoglutarate aldolase
VSAGPQAAPVGPVRDGDLARASRAGTATLHEASGGQGALPAAIQALQGGMTVAGIALTVACPPRDNLWIHRALYDERTPASVLVVETSGYHEAGYWGEVLARAALARGARGIVIDGCVRDSAALAEIGLPTFCRGRCIRGTTKVTNGTGGIGRPVTIGGVQVATGDLVLGDADGVIVLSSADVGYILDSADDRIAREAAVIDAMRHGARTLDLYGFSDRD